MKTTKDWLDCLKSFIDGDNDLNDRLSKAHMLMLIENIENDLEQEND